MTAAPHPSEPALYELFEKLGLSYRTEEHRAVFTVAEGSDVKARLPGGHSKNLFLKDKTGQFVLVSALGSTVIKLNQLHKRIGTKRLSFGKPDALLELLGVVPGSVTIFAILNDTDCKIRLIMDKALFDHEAVWFHPMRNTASTRMAPGDIVTFAEATGHAPTLIDFTEDLS